ncbi:hypothetical protein Vi05172_g11594 [Venturia inaequalis]|nr:hypothetical protein Vi05172_g11594 [Venturia inaequalis]
MLPLVPIVTVAYLALYTFAFSIPSNLRPSQRPLGASLQVEKTDLGAQSSLVSWLEHEEKIALDKLLQNVAPGGVNAPDAAPGTVIASPSKTHPNYYYQWVRDAAITVGTLVELYREDSSSYVSSKVVPIIEAYAGLSNKIQHTHNPSGSFDDLSGLGEPKFMVDGTPFTENWGRPQRDGPPLRAITLMQYLSAYNISHSELWNTANGVNPFADLYDSRLPANSTIKADLEYVSHFWRESGFDLWEEVNGLHFFTAIVQLRALREGSKLASSFGDHGAARFYYDQASELEKTLLPRFWDSNKGHIIETLDSPRSGLDCGILLGSIHGTTPECSTDPSSASQCSHAPYSDEILVTLYAMVRDQRLRFPINAIPSQEAFDPLAGVGIGRYPEDGYNGYETIAETGNPWFLCTSSTSEVLYRTRLHLLATNSLKVTERGLPFWKALTLRDNLQTGTYAKGDPIFIKAVERLQSVGDSFLAVLKTHVDGEGAMSEQFHRVSGFMEGARDLTWSYGAFLQAVRARKAAN